MRPLGEAETLEKGGRREGERCDVVRRVGSVVLDGRTIPRIGNAVEDIKSSSTICQSPLSRVHFISSFLFHLHFLSELGCDLRTRRHREARHDTPADSPPLDRLVSLNATLPPPPSDSFNGKIPWNEGKSIAAR